MTAVERRAFPSARLTWALVAAGVVFRVATLGSQSIWLDEAFDIWAATKHTAEYIWTTRLDPNEPALYYLILHWCLGQLGVSEAAARLPSAINSVLGIGLAYWLGCRLVPGRSVGRLAAVLLAVAPLDVWYAQEARMHGFVGTAALLVALGLVVPRWWAGALLTAGLAFGLAIDHTMWLFALLLLGAWMAFWWQNGRRPWDLVRVTVATAAGLWIYRPVWPQAVDVFNRLHTVTVFANARRALGLTEVAAVPFPVFLIVALAACAALGATVLAAARRPVWRPRLDALVIAGFTAFTVLAVVPRVYGFKQVLVGGWPVMTVLAAAALAARPRLARIAVVASVCGIVVTVFTPRADWRGVAALLSARPAAATIVVLDPGYNSLPYEFYRPGATSVGGPVDSKEKLTAGRPGAVEACLIAQRFGPAPPTSPSEQWLDGHLPLKSATRFARLEVRCYNLQ